MSMHNFLEALTELPKIFGLMFPLIGSYFFVRRSIWSPASSIYELSRTKWDYDKPLADDLCAQKADSFVGLAYIVFGITAQAVLLFTPVERPFASPVRLNLLNLFFAVATVFVFKWLGNAFSRWFERRLIRKVDAMAEGKAKK